MSSFTVKGLGDMLNLKEIDNNIREASRSVNKARFDGKNKHKCKSYVSCDWCLPLLHLSTVSSLNIKGDFEISPIEKLLAQCESGMYSNLLKDFIVLLGHHKNDAETAKNKEEIESITNGFKRILESND